jgi:hypothetical protein
VVVLLLAFGVLAFSAFMQTKQKFDEITVERLNLVEKNGLIFGAVKGGDKYGAYGGFTFDQYQQSQAIGLIYNDHTGNREVGLSVVPNS